MNARIIAVGEALVEVMRLSVGQPLDQTGEFAGPFASGAPAIFAVAAARLGHAVRFVGGIGQDAFGRLLRVRFEAEGVETAWLQTAPDKATGVAFVAYAPDGSREFVFHLRFSAAGALQAEQVTEACFERAAWLHVSGSTLALNDASREACARCLAYVQAAGGKLSFDPNLRPELMPLQEARRVFAPYLEAADLLLPTADEARLLAGTEDDDRAAAILAPRQGQTLVYKQGAAGCLVYAQGIKLKVPGYKVEEVDPTGAGDCFNAAFVSGLAQGWSFQDTARFACAAGALAVTRQGPMEGAPSRSMVETFIATHLTTLKG